MADVFGWLSRWFDKRRRQIDIEILWPLCVENAPSLDHAKAAFAVHAMNDDAWLSLGADEALAIIEGLKP